MMINLFEIFLIIRYFKNLQSKLEKYDFTNLYLYYSYNFNPSFIYIYIYNHSDAISSITIYIRNFPFFVLFFATPSDERAHVIHHSTVVDLDFLLEKANQASQPNLEHGVMSVPKSYCKLQPHLMR